MFSLDFDQDTNSLGVAITDKTCLIMDEVDGMSAGDRGGVGALNALIKKTKVRLEASPSFRSVEAWEIRCLDSNYLYREWQASAEVETPNGHYF